VAGPQAGHRTGFEGNPTVDDDQFDAGRDPGRIGERSPVGDGRRVEEDDVGRRAGGDDAAAGQPERRRRAGRHLRDGLFPRQEAGFADVPGEHPGERGDSAGVRLATAARRRPVGADDSAGVPQGVGDVGGRHGEDTHPGGQFTGDEQVGQQEYAEAVAALLRREIR
jgi:hypothetical protein